MKIDVTQDALLRALVEAIRDERDHGGALMRLMLRLVNEAGKRDWFETHGRTEARLESRSTGLWPYSHRVAVRGPGA